MSQTSLSIVIFRQAHIIHGSITLKHIYLHLSPNGKSLHSVALGIHDSAIDLHPYFNILQQQQQPPLDNTNITDIIIEHQLSDIQDLCDVINLELNGFLNAIEFDELSLIVPHELENPTTDLDLLITNIEMWVDENLKSAFVLEEDLPLDEFQLAYFCQTRAMLDTVDEEGMFITDNTSEVSLAHLTVAR